MPRVCDDGLTTAVLPVTKRGGGHAGTDGQGKVPGADDRGHAAGLMPLVVQFAHEPAQPAGLEQPDGHAGVILAEVDGLADVGIGLAPGLARLANHHGGQPIAAAAHRGGGLQRGSAAVQGLAIAPGRKGLGGRGDGLLAGIRADGRDLGHVDFGHRFRKMLPLIFLGKIAPRLVEHRPIAAQPGNGGRKLMPGRRGGRQSSLAYVRPAFQRWTVA